VVRYCLRQIFGYISFLSLNKNSLQIVILSIPSAFKIVVSLKTQWINLSKHPVSQTTVITIDAQSNEKPILLSRIMLQSINTINELFRQIKSHNL